MKTTEKASTRPCPGPRARWRFCNPQLSAEGVINGEPRADTYHSPVCLRWPAVCYYRGVFVQRSDGAPGRGVRATHAKPLEVTPV